MRAGASKLGRVTQLCFTFNGQASEAVSFGARWCPRRRSQLRAELLGDVDQPTRYAEVVVGGVVVEDQMDLESVRDFAVDRLEELQELDVAMTGFSGQDQLPGLVSQAGTWSLSALARLIVLKVLAYGLPLGSYRGGPTAAAVRGDTRDAADNPRWQQRRAADHRRRRRLLRDDAANDATADAGVGASTPTRAAARARAELVSLAVYRARGLCTGVS
jgi:hypothetical protein